MKRKQKSYSKMRTLVMVMMCLIIGMLSSTPAFAAENDVPTKGWDQLAGSTASDELFDVIKTTDGNFVSAGKQGTDAMLVKTSPQGTIIWKKIVHANISESFNSVTELNDGSIIAAGFSLSSANGDITDSNHGSMDCLLVKFSANGDKLWDKLIGGSQIDEIKSIIATEDGGFIAAGYSLSSAEGDIIDSNNGSNNTSDGYIVKFGSDGTIQWDNLFGSPEADWFFSIIQTSDGGFIAAGTAADLSDDGIDTNSGGEITDSPATPGPNPQDGLLVKFDSSGHIVWNKLFGSDSDDIFYGLAATSDGGCVVSGTAAARNGDITTGEISSGNTALVAKFNGEGQAQWNRVFTGGAGYSVLMDVKTVSDGSFYVVGFAGSEEATADGILAKISASGSVLGIDTFDGAADDNFAGLVVDRRGHIIVVGSTTSSQSGDLQSVSNGVRDGLIVYYGFAPELFSINFEENGGATVPNQVIAYGNKVITPAEPVRSGYTFEGWYSDKEFSKPFAFSLPIRQDATLFAKWYVHITMDTIVSDTRTISGHGQPGLSVIVSLPNGSKISNIVKTDGKWLADLPKEYTLTGGDKVKATMYDIFNNSIEVSSAEKVVTAANIPPKNVVQLDNAPKTGDLENLFPAWCFGLCLGFTIMVRAFKGPKVRRRY